MPPFGATRADPEGIALREVSRVKKGQSPAVFLTRGTRNGKPQVKPQRRMNSQTRRTERRDQRGEGGGGGGGRGPGARACGAGEQTLGAGAPCRARCCAPVLRLKFTNVVDRPRPMDLIFKNAAAELRGAPRCALRPCAPDMGFPQQRVGSACVRRGQGVLSPKAG